MKYTLHILGNWQTPFGTLRPGFSSQKWARRTVVERERAFVGRGNRMINGTPGLKKKQQVGHFLYVPLPVFRGDEPVWAACELS
jgi:hypothetical protein